MRCTYSIDHRPGFVCLTDLDQGMSITNASEQVIQDLIHAGFDLIANRVIYQDTMGIGTNSWCAWINLGASHLYGQRRWKQLSAWHNPNSEERLL
jgi:hypothetical protein